MDWTFDGSVSVRRTRLIASNLDRVLDKVDIGTVKCVIASRGIFTQNRDQHKDL